MVHCGDSDGGCYVTTFDGPMAEQRAQTKLSLKSNQIARGRIRQFESDMPSQAVQSQWAMSAWQEYARAYRQTVESLDRSRATSDKMRIRGLRLPALSAPAPHCVCCAS